MRIISLALFNIKRISRNMFLWMFLFALPMAFALYFLFFAKTGVINLPAYFLPVLCAIVVTLVLLGVYKSDLSSGLVDGFKTVQLKNLELSLPYIIAGTFIYAVQMLVFIVITKILT